MPNVYYDNPDEAQEAAERIRKAGMQAEVSIDDDGETRLTCDDEAFDLLDADEKSPTVD